MSDKNRRSIDPVFESSLLTLKVISFSERKNRLHKLMTGNFAENMFCIPLDYGCEIVETICPPVVIEECMELDPCFFDHEPISTIPPSTNMQMVLWNGPLTTRSEVSSNSTHCSSTRALREIDLNAIKNRLEQLFSDPSLDSTLDDAPLTYLNGEVNKQIVTRKPYESDIRKKKYEGVITMKERRMKADNVAFAETVKCSCKTRCCLSFSAKDILDFRVDVYTMIQKDRKEYFIRDLLKNGTRTENAFDFKYFLNQKQVCLLEKRSLANERFSPRYARTATKYRGEAFIS